MTIVMLASLSLFTLVVTSRPILPDSDLSDLLSTLSTFQATAQAAFHVHPGKDDLKLDTTRFHSQTSKQQIEYVSELQTEDTVALTSIGISPLFDETASRRIEFGPYAFADSRADFGIDENAVTNPMVSEREALVDEPPTAPLVVLAFSCVTAFLALACIALTLYIIKSLPAQMLVSNTAWKLLPCFWRTPISKEDLIASAKKGGNFLPLQREVEQRLLLDIEEGFAERPGSRDAEEKPLYFDAISDMVSESDDLDENYQDALDRTPHPVTHDLPLEPHIPLQSHRDDPPSSFPPAVSCPADQPTADRSLLMHDLCSSLISRPAWSVRAVDSPLLGLPSREIDDVDPNSQLLIHPRRYAYRSALPEFDIVLAMQLRPGLGRGADPAWMVRFLMAMFGWLAVALTSSNR